MRLGRNLLAGLANSVWTALIGFAVVPIYIKYLGIEAYGVIGFFATTQAVLSLLDLGLAPAINREVARCSASGEMKEARNLLSTVSIIYWGMAALIAVAGVLLAPFVAGHWLQSNALSVETLTHAVMAMSLVVACRWPIGQYLGALMGMQLIGQSSLINIFMVTLNSLGAIVILAFVSPTIEAFFLWQTGVAIAYVTLMRAFAWRAIGTAGVEKFDSKRLKKIWRFSAGMSGIAVSGVILMQLDKVLLSNLLSLEDFGRYALAGVVSSGLYVMLTPLFNAICPRLTALVAAGDSVKLIEMYRSGTKLFLSAFFPVAVAAAVFSKDILYLWTGNSHLAATAAPIVSLILIGTMLNGVMHFPYALLLAYGETRIPLVTNLILISLMVPLTIYLTTEYGGVGGGASWAILNTIYVFVGTYRVHKKLLPQIGRAWLLSDVLLPLAVSVLLTGFGCELMAAHYTNIPSHVAAGFVLALLSFMVSISINRKISMNEIKNIFVQSFNRNSK